MRFLCIVIGTVIIFGLFNSCNGDLKDRIRGHWISHETTFTSGTKSKVDSLRVIEILGDGTYFIFGREEILGKWSLTKEKGESGEKDLLIVTINDSSIVYEVLDIKNDELVLLELANEHETSIRIPFKRVKM